MNCEVIAVGSELLLGGAVDTNSSWIGERLAEHGIDSYFHTAVGDNEKRIADALSAALARSDAVIVTGGLGPTQDDITREAIARVMGVELEFDTAQRNNIAAMFEARGREMAKNNERQARRPRGAKFIEQRKGTAPGLICELGGKVVYAMPGFPHEMRDMMQREVLPDLAARSGANKVIVSRLLRVWGIAESTLAEMVEPRIAANVDSSATLAFLAHGVEGIHIRITAKADSRDGAGARLDAEEAELRVLLGPLVFGIDDQTMETAVSSLLLSKQVTLAVAESLTGGLISSRLTEVPGGSGWFRGGVVSYASDVKFNVLDVPEGPVVSADAARAMANGVRRLLGSDIGVAVTGVAGPASQEGQPIGVVHAAIAMPGEDGVAFEMRLFGDRQRIRELACINVLDALRRQLSQ